MIIDHIDPINRDIYLSANTVGTSLHPIDIYKEMRTLRLTDESLRQYDLFLAAYGNVPKGGGKFTERYVVCLNGARIVPFNTTHSLTISGIIITDDGQEGIACFDRSPLSSTSRVDINYTPPQVEVITVNTSGGGDITTQDKIDIANLTTDSVWNADRNNHNISGTMGEYLQKGVLSFKKFMGIYKK